MNFLKAMIASAALAGLLGACGLETAGTAATGAAIKKQELEQGKNTMKQAQEKIDAAAKQIESRTAAGDSEK